MLIGSSGQYEAPFSPDECGRRLNADPSAGSYTGHADGAGFQLAIYGRTAVRIRGAFTPTSNGTRVDYRVEFSPGMIWALAIAFAVSIPVLIAMGRYAPVSMLGALPIVVVVLAANLWISEWQARRLRDHVASVLNAGPNDLSAGDVRPLA